MIRPLLPSRRYSHLVEEMDSWRRGGRGGAIVTRSGGELVQVRIALAQLDDVREGVEFSSTQSGS